MRGRCRIVQDRVNLAVNDTDYTLHVPEGACSVRVSLNDVAVSWRWGTSTVAAAGSGAAKAAGSELVLSDDVEVHKQDLHVAVSAGGGVALHAVLSCLVPTVR